MEVTVILVPLPVPLPGQERFMGPDGIEEHPGILGDLPQVPQPVREKGTTGEDE